MQSSVVLFDLLVNMHLEIELIDWDKKHLSSIAFRVSEDRNESDLLLVKTALEDIGCVFLVELAKKWGIDLKQSFSIPKEKIEDYIDNNSITH